MQSNRARKNISLLLEYFFWNEEHKVPIEFERDRSWKSVGYWSRTDYKYFYELCV